METDFANVPANGYSPEQIAQMGERYYFDELKNILEKDKRGQYVVIDVVNKKYTVASDKLAALDNAEKEMGKQLFYIIQVGSLQKPVASFKKRAYAWQL